MRERAEKREESATQKRTSRRKIGKKKEKD